MDIIGKTQTESYSTICYSRLVNDKIRQWYGIKDSKPDRENVEAFLNAYIQHITGKGGKKTA